MTSTSLANSCDDPDVRALGFDDSMSSTEVHSNAAASRVALVDNMSEGGGATASAAAVSSDLNGTKRPPPPEDETRMAYILNKGGLSSFNNNFFLHE